MLHDDDDDNDDDDDDNDAKTMLRSSKFDPRPVHVQSVVEKVV
jgi:hypothetical protein